MPTAEIQVTDPGGAPGPSGSAARVEHPTLAQRAATGKAARERASRASHGHWQAAPDRRDPVDVLTAGDIHRVSELLPIRYGRMLVSPFTFYRGSAALMAADLAGGPRTGLVVQLCGDAHLSNFGAFVAPDRRLVFSINDFDETLPGPFEWDLKRLAASFAVAGRDRGFDVDKRRSVLLAVAGAYREAMRDFARMPTLDIWYARLDVDEIRREWEAVISGTARKRFDRNVAKARAHDSLSVFGKLTRVVDGEPRIISNPPLITPLEELVGDDARDTIDEKVHSLVRAYRETLGADRRRLLDRFRYVHAARKVVGVGSVGTRVWIVLLVGNDLNDPLLLQVKEASQSELEPFLGASSFGTHGQRVVEGQRMMQSASDIMLGWVSTPGLDGVHRDFYVRQLWDGKGSAIIEAMNPRVMKLYANVCGWTLARAHARSGDPAAIASYLGSGSSFDEAMASFSELYADQNERDYAALRQAVDDGRITATPGL